MKKQTMAVTAVFALVFLFQGLTLFAQSSELVATGFARSRFAAQVDDGALFINEQMLSTSLDWKADTAAAHGDLSLILEEGKTLTPDLKELYIDWLGESFNLRIGKQKILWGKADGVFITDLVSPKDLSAFLTKDIGELRLGVMGAKLDYFAGPHQLEIVWLPLFTPAILPKAGSIWGVSPSFPITPTMTPAVLPESSLGNGEYFARYSFLGSLLDFQLMGGWFWNDTPIAAITAKTIVPMVGVTAITIQPQYYKVGVGGLAASLPLGPLILKTEGSYTWNQRYQAKITPTSTGWVEKNDLQYLVGGDISFMGATLSAQWIQDMVLEHDDTLVRDEMINSVTAILQQSFLEETLRAEVFTVVNLKDSDAMVKPQLTWIPGNGFQTALGGWFFLGDSGQFGQYKSNNGIYLSTTFFF